MSDAVATPPASSPPPPKRYTLVDLPVIPRLVLSLFLISVGLGYFSALVQLHFQHASKGEAMPLPKDVVDHFTNIGWDRWQQTFKDGGAPKTEERPRSRLETLVTATVGKFTGSGSMAPAFFARSEDWKDACKERGEKVVRPEREGEQKALAAWIAAGAPKTDYDADQFDLPSDWGKQPITAEYLEGNALKVRSILAARCVRCHGPGGEQSSYPLDTHDAIAKYTKLPKAGVATNTKQLSLEKLTQSTHVHLLGFSMLYGLTGLIFAYTRVWTPVRLVVAPLALLAQIADISCWWLARLDGVGPYFALAIMGTGGVVGLSLATHILFSLFDMWKAGGKITLVALFIAAGFGGTIVYTQVIQPHLAAELKEIDEGERQPAKTPDQIKKEQEKLKKAKEFREQQEKSKTEEAEKQLAEKIKAAIDGSVAERAEKEKADRDAAAKSAAEAAAKGKAEREAAAKSTADAVAKAEAAVRAAAEALVKEKAERAAAEKATAAVIEQEKTARLALEQALKDRVAADAKAAEERDARLKALQALVEKAAADATARDKRVADALETLPARNAAVVKQVKALTDDIRQKLADLEKANKELADKVRAAGEKPAKDKDKPAK